MRSQVARRGDHGPDRRAAAGAVVGARCRCADPRQRLVAHDGATMRRLSQECVGVSHQAGEGSTSFGLAAIGCSQGAHDGTAAPTADARPALAPGSRLRCRAGPTRAAPGTSAPARARRARSKCQTNPNPAGILGNPNAQHKPKPTMASQRTLRYAPRAGRSVASARSERHGQQAAERGCVAEPNEPKSRRNPDESELTVTKAARRRGRAGRVAGPARHPRRCARRAGPR